MAHRQTSITAAPESSNFFVRVTLLSLSGRKDNKTFRVVLLKGVQIVASTKYPWRMENGMLNFQTTNLDFALLSYNVKRPNNAELSIVLYELQEQDHTSEDEIGCINIPISELVGALVEKNITKHEKKDNIEPYKLQYWIKVARNRPEGYGQQLPQQAVSTIQPAEVAAEPAEPVSPPKPAAIEDEPPMTPERPEPTGKIRAIEQDQLIKVEAEAEQPKPQEDSKELSLLNVTEEVSERPGEVSENPLEPPVEPVHEDQHSEEVKKSDVKLKHTVSMDADRIVKNLEGEKPKQQPQSAKFKLEGNTRKLAIAVVVVLLLIYFLFLRSGPKPESEERIKDEKPTKPKKNKKKSKV